MIQGMLKPALVFAAGMLGFATAAQTQQDRQLPRRTDIPAAFATYICTEAATARQLVTDFLARERYRAANNAPGCRMRSDNDGEITITAAIERHRLQAIGSTWLVYRGKTADGRDVYGAVDEDANNTYPRSPLESFIQGFARDRTIAAKTDDDRPTYICSTPANASAVILAIAGAQRRRQTAQQQVAAFNAALRLHDCRRATGTYRITAVHDNVTIVPGDEQDETWTALTAMAPGGGEVGLLFDASPYR